MKLCQEVKKEQIQNSQHKEKNMNKKGRWLDMGFEESGCQSLLVITAGKKYASFEVKFFAVENKFLSILSTVASDETKAPTKVTKAPKKVTF